MSEADSDVTASVRKFVVEELAAMKGSPGVRYDESLIESGILDSFGVFRLVTFMEEEFEIQFADDEVSAENLRTIDTIASFIRGKTA